LELPDDVLLSKFTKSCLYCDEKSEEKTTRKIKPKYKLAGSIILEHYFFHVLTRTLDACKRSYTLTINQEDWEAKITGPYLQEKTSYCDVSKPDLIYKLNLLTKIKDRANGFIYIARLCSAKYEELLKLNEKMQKDPDITEETKAIVNSGLSDKIDEIVLRLGL